MSSDGDAAAEIVAFFASLQPDAYVALSAIVFFLYDYIITVGREVELFWTRKVTGASVLFFFIRYGTILYKILDLVVYAPVSDKSCSMLFQAFTMVEILRYLPFAVFAGMRAWALSTNWMLSSLVLALSLLPLAVNLARFSFGISGENVPIIGCEGTAADPTSAQVLLWPILSRAGFILADLLLVVITWRSLARGNERTRLSNGKRMTFADILFWNGTLYFVTLFTLNVLHLSFSLPALFNDDGISDITVFTDPLSAVLIYRFLLDLQEANQRVVRLDADDPLSTMDSVESLSFVARTMGSLRSTIVPGLLENEDEDVSITDVVHGSSIPLEELHECDTRPPAKQHGDLAS
ncbi:hypothetical protein OH76DRAFT_1400910 [Lentinus brumalis]|uniref:DUF6533 domain-containing protein n=1 Tax=Lentinus brumalis TaxID=2498619 RepID=A0A371DHI7_9APHY|nr:hypothetical protein OH76DRAFT_1400910 [Polyporus brumalis]